MFGQGKAPANWYLKDPVKDKIYGVGAEEAYKLLTGKKAKEVIVAATHAVFSGPAVERLKASKVTEVVVTDSLPIDEDKRFDGLTVLSIAPLLARAIREVFEDGSVTSLFDGHS